MIGTSSRRQGGLKGEHGIGQGHATALPAHLVNDVLPLAAYASGASGASEAGGRCVG